MDGKIRSSSARRTGEIRGRPVSDSQIGALDPTPERIRRLIGLLISDAPAEKREDRADGDFVQPKVDNRKL